MPVKETVTLPPAMAALQKWRNADHEDRLTLTRDDVITLIEEEWSALLDARAELAQARADAKAAQALVVERFRHDLQFMVDSIAEDKAYVADKYPALFKTIQARLAEMGTFGGVQVFGEIARDLLVLADADGLAAVDALRAEARENAMQALASMGQAQDAYEAQLEAEAELAAAQQREAGLRGALSYLRTQAKNGTLHPQVVIQNADASLAAWPEDGE